MATLWDQRCQQLIVTTFVCIHRNFERSIFNRFDCASVFRCFLSHFIKMEQRYSIKFYVKLQDSATETFDSYNELVELAPCSRHRFTVDRNQFWVAVKFWRWIPFCTGKHSTYCKRVNCCVNVLEERAFIWYPGHLTLLILARVTISYFLKS